MLSFCLAATTSALRRTLLPDRAVGQAAGKSLGRLVEMVQRLLPCVAFSYVEAFEADSTTAERGSSPWG